MEEEVNSAQYSSILALLPFLLFLFNNSYNSFHLRNSKYSAHICALIVLQHVASIINTL